MDARPYLPRAELAVAAEGQRVHVNEMREAESMALLSSGLSGFDHALAQQIAQKLGDWPIALELAGATIRQRLSRRLDDTCDKPFA
jgi:ABC-type amino acid transport substrate-binding protein